MFHAKVNSAADLLTYYRAHTSANKPKVHGSHYKRLIFYITCCYSDGFIHPGFLPGFFESFAIRLEISEFHEVIGNQVIKEANKPLIENELEIFFGTNTLMVLALRAFVKILLEIFLRAGSVSYTHLTLPTSDLV